MAELSVVVACPGPDERAGPSLDGLERALEGMASEVILVHPSGAPPRGADRPRVRRVPVGGKSLVPEMWAAGYHLSGGEAVAFTTSHFVVSEDWARDLVAALRGGAAGAGGPIRLGSGAGALDRAIHLLRYSSFAAKGQRETVREIPGDNAAYRREALRRHEEALRGGLWDVELHRRLRAEGEVLVWVPSAGAAYAGSHRPAAFLRQRFRHGARYGRYRTRELGTPTWRTVLAAPLVPAVLTLRSLGSLRGRPGRWLRSLPAIPWLLCSAAAWAGGEAWGSWSAAKGTTNRTTEPT